MIVETKVSLPELFRVLGKVKIIAAIGWLFQPAILTFSLQEYVLEDVTEGDETEKTVELVDDNEAMDTGFTDGVKNGVETVVNRACIDAREIL